MKKLLHIGRSKDNEIILADPSVSKQHAQLLIYALDNVGIVDLGSTNGTFVNRKRVQGYTQLKQGDVVHLGDSLLTWRTYVQEFAGTMPATQPAEPAPSPLTTGASQRQTASLPPQAPQQIIVQLPPAEKKPSGWNIYLFSIGLLLLGVLVFAVIRSKGISMEAALALPETIGLSVECGSVENMLVTSMVALQISNRSDRIHDAITIRVNGTDKWGSEVISKLITLEEPLGPSMQLKRPVSLPAKVKSCTCEVVDSNPR
jgi:hypothetical protein